MGDLSKHFSKEELGCQCKYRDCDFGYKDGDISPRLISMIEKIREKWGRPLYKWQLSGCRCTRHNRDVNGATRSRHLRGIAIDIAFSDPHERKNFYELVMDMYHNGELPELGGVGYAMYHNGCIHLDTDKADDGHLRTW